MPICTRCGFRNEEVTQFCGNCGAPVSGVAISSPPVETGAHQLPRRRGRARKFALYFLLTIGVGVAILALIMAIFAGDDAPTSTTSVTTATPAQATPAQKAEKPILVNAASLWAGYHDNEVAADNRYKGKRLIVQGKVQGINKDNLNPANDSGTDEAYVSFFTGVDYEPVKAYIKSDSLAQVARLQINQIVTVNCNGAGMVSGSPMLNDCSILLDNSTAEPAKPTQDNAPQKTQATDSEAAQTPKEAEEEKQLGLVLKAWGEVYKATPTTFNERQNLRIDAAVVMRDDTVCFSVHDAHPFPGVVEPDAFVYLPHQGNGNLYAVTDVTFDLWTRECVNQQGGVDVGAEIKAAANQLQQESTDQ
jgi:hypothetical protein